MVTRISLTYIVDFIFVDVAVNGVELNPIWVFWLNKRSNCTIMLFSKDTIWKEFEGDGGIVAKQGGRNESVS